VEPLKRDRLGAGDALAVFGVSFVGFTLSAWPFAGCPGGQFARQLLFLALPGLAAVTWRGLAPRSALGLVRPRGTDLAAAGLLGLGLWAVNLTFVVPLVRLAADLPAELWEPRAGTEDRDLVVTAALIVVPAFCEELLCRGILARSLARQAGPAGAVLVSTLMFAALHDPIRMLPAAAFGAACGLLAVRSDSAVPSLVTHFLNNLIVLAVIPSVAWARAAVTGHPLAIGAIGIIAVGAGLWLTVIARKPVGPHPQDEGPS
jgi:uncharacterized protein